jgi:hypothetical protein
MVVELLRGHPVSAAYPTLTSILAILCLRCQSASKAISNDSGASIRK